MHNSEWDEIYEEWVSQGCPKNEDGKPILPLDTCPYSGFLDCVSCPYYIDDECTHPDYLRRIK